MCVVGVSESSGDHSLSSEQNGGKTKQIYVGYSIRPVKVQLGSNSQALKKNDIKKREINR